MSLDRPKRFVFRFFWGAEVRVFAFSGLLEYLSGIGEVCVATRYRSPDLEEEIGPRVQWSLLPRMTVPLRFSRLNTLCNAAHGAAVRRSYRGMAVRDRAAVGAQRSGMSAFLRGPLVHLLSQKRVVSALNTRAMTLADRLCLKVGDQLNDVLRDPNEITLVTADYLSAESALLRARARQGGARVVFYPSNWRDLYKGVRLDSGYTDILTWNPEMAAMAQRNNPWLRDRSVHAVGSTQFDSHFREDWLVSRDQFCADVGLDPSRPILCYSAASEKAYSGESRVLDEILTLLSRSDTGTKIQVLVRLNPAGSDSGFRELPAKHPERVVVSQPRWWVEGHSEGEPAWRANTIQDARLFSNMIEHSFLNVGLPSTVMLDFSVRGKPSIAIGFDPGGDRRSRAKDFTGQIFIKNALDRGVWQVSADAGNLVDGVLREYIVPGTRRRSLIDHASQVVGRCDGRVHEKVGSYLAELSVR